MDESTENPAKMIASMHDMVPLALYFWCSSSRFIMILLSVSVYYVAVRTIVLSRHGSNLTTRSD